MSSKNKGSQPDSGSAVQQNQSGRTPAQTASPNMNQQKKNPGK